LLDGEKLGTTPLAGPMRIDVGARQLRVTKPGFKEFSETEQVAGAAEVAVNVNLVKEVHEGHLYVDADPKDAISIDGKVVATGKWEGVLSSGGHALRITAPGFITHQSDVMIQDGQSRHLSISLQPAGAGSKGVSSAWFWGGGGVLVAAGVVAAVILTRPAKPEPTAGTMSPGTVAASFGGGGIRFGGVR
jgi:hypothetical protein